MVLVHRGRKSGKVSPKLAATLIACSVGIPVTAIGVVSGIYTSPSFLQFIVADILIFIFMWLAVYSSPFGIGLWVKWDEYVYPKKIRKDQESSMDLRMPASQGKSASIFQSWRFWAGMVATGEFVVLTLCGIILHNNFIIFIGIIIAIVYSAVFIGIWHLKQAWLRQRGWRW